MTTYWLSRNGGGPEGPYAVSQIIVMWTSGLFTATDLLCEFGARDWQPASFVMQYVDAALMEPSSPSVQTFGTSPSVAQKSSASMAPATPLSLARSRLAPEFEVYDPPEPPVPSFWRLKGWFGAAMLAFVVALVTLIAFGFSQVDRGMDESLKSAEGWTSRNHPDLRVTRISKEYQTNGGNVYRTVQMSDGSKFVLKMDGTRVMTGVKL